MARLAQFTKIAANTIKDAITSRVINTLQDNLQSVFQQFLTNPILYGTILPNIVLTQGANQINHNLGCELTGWIIIRSSGENFVYDNQATNPMPDKTLLLTNLSGSSITVSLYVF